MINSVLYKPPEEKIQRHQIFRTRDQALGLLFLANDKEIACPERHEHDGRIEMVHHLP
jgi:hypothetical protein